MPPSVLHVPFCYEPDPIGGTEVYVAGLARELASTGVRVAIAAPTDGPPARYLSDGLPVHRYPVPVAVGDLRELYGAGSGQAGVAFARVLDEVAPDVLHLHAYTRATSAPVVREAQRRGVPVVFTYHTPAASCQRGTLLRFGRDVCDGRVEATRCASCVLHGLGLPRALSRVGGHLPLALSRAVGGAGLAGGPWTALRMRDLMDVRAATLGEFCAAVDAIVVVCEWAREVLRVNGVEPEKVVLSRHGLSHGGAAVQHPRAGAGEGRLRVAYLGRMTPAKGPHLLLEALRSRPELPVELDLYGVIQGAADTDYSRELQGIAGGDRRIRFMAPVAPPDVVGVLGQYDLTAVPSQGLETGPLVVLESFAARVPVLGSKLGGIAELVRHDVDGILVEGRAAADWRDALVRFAESPELRRRLRDGIRPPRTMATVAEEMRRLYERVSARRGRMWG